MKACLVLIIAVLFASCKSPSQTTNDPLDKQFTFILHDTLKAAHVSHLSDALYANYERIKQNLNLQSLPTITVQIWSDEEAYQSAMEQRLGSRFPGSRGYVTGDRELRLLYHRRLSAQKEAVHEFAHVASLNLNPDFGNNPRWLWEAFAMYQAEELRDPREIDYMRERDFPTLEELNAGFNTNKNIYDVGYLLVDYIVTNWSMDTLVELVKSNGDIDSVLQVSVSQFEEGWHQFIEEKYLTPEP